MTRVLVTLMFTDYCRLTKLWEGNVFSRVCLFTGGGVTFDRYPLCIGAHCTESHASDIWWPPLETCFKLGHFRTRLTSAGYCSCHSCHKREVHILLQYFLVTACNEVGARFCFTRVCHYVHRGEGLLQGVSAPRGLVPEGT